MLKNKWKFLIPLSSFCLLTLIPLVAASCSEVEIAKKTYYSRSKTENGLDVLREYSPIGLHQTLPFGAKKELPLKKTISTDWLWNPLDLYREYVSHLINSNDPRDDHFKAKHAATYDRINQLQDQYAKTENKKESNQLDAEIEKLKRKVANDWQQNNIALNKDKIFHLINKSEDFNKIQTERFKKYFKDFDFSNKSILLIKGYLERNVDPPAIGAGYWIKNLTISNNTINIQYKYKEIPIKKKNPHITSPGFRTSSTVHLVVVDKIQSLDNYQIIIS
ncbi:hypothetical protein JM47_01985 [Ureaplasma diversum]|uniref:Lipoprotein n=1 Tax=Ureaplasma diversum TaxID=42094 RepID=A0A0C5RPN2_9BACT|nr:hypothetical protein [Ureaplasma diversum]AJQ45359.1 hypothetical protein JM47_01985 [Ureaplasma diversum]